MQCIIVIPQLIRAVFIFIVIVIRFFFQGLIDMLCDMAAGLLRVSSRTVKQCP